MSLLYRIVKNKWTPPADPDSLSFTGKTIIVTGSNVGLGAEAAHKFAAQGAARLILAVRNEEKGAKVQKIVQHIASDPKCKVEVWKLDMLDYDSIKAFAKRCNDELERLDIAVLNAGVYNAAFKKSKYGWEESLQVNTLSTAALGLLLLPKLRASKTAEITPVLEFVNSGRHYAVQLDDAQKTEPNVNILTSLNGEDAFDSSKLYCMSKFLLMGFAKTLATRLQPDQAKPAEVHVVSVCPGACQSNLARDMNSVPLQVAKFAANTLFLRTTEEGSRTLVSGTAQGEDGHGGFWQNDVIREPMPLLQGQSGEKLMKKMYDEILSALQQDVPEAVECSPSRPAVQ